jgi:dihydropteroate synthase
MTALVWQCRDRRLDLGRRPAVMGIVNVTPDSFSDGGTHADTASAVEHGLRLAADGSDILDVGGESTRPGSLPVPEADELARVLPVVTALAKRTSALISVDTSKAVVARACLATGAHIINDVTGLCGDPEMPAVAAEYAAGVVVMHMQGTPATMQQAPHYGDVVREVRAYLEERLHALAAVGIPPEAVCLDPGFGFGKTREHNLILLANLGAIASLGRPVCLGVSRKGFIGKAVGRESADRDIGSLALACFAAARGQAHVIRVHAVAPTRDAAVLLDAIDRYRR